MFATATSRTQPFRHAVEALKLLHHTAAFASRPDRTVTRDTEANLDRMALRTRDEMGLLSGEGCVTDWGLLERAERLRSGWT